MDHVPSRAPEVASTEVRAQAATERERVTQWRITRLTEAGYDRDSSLLIGIDSSIDLHLAIGLLKRGCTVENALQILF
jgi:hypothetical protein